MRALVTGVGGFIGSTIAEALIAEGHEVRGVDCFTSFYDPAIKRRNLQTVADHPCFDLVEADLRSADVVPMVRDADVVFHLAGQPGTRVSWAGFSEYVSNNVLATQRLLEAVKGVPVRRFVYASSSSVYGNAARYPTEESAVPHPHSPYGVTKLAGEHLCVLYADNWDIPAVALRYFTVYGPRQRPDMGIHLLLDAGLSGSRFELYGDGTQRRDFTFVDDVVDATRRAAEADVPPGAVINVAGGAPVSVNALIDAASSAIGASIAVERRPPQPGDVDATGGAIERARELLGWQPATTLEQGLSLQARWQQELATG